VIVEVKRKKIQTERNMPTPECKAENGHVFYITMEVTALGA